LFLLPRRPPPPLLLMLRADADGAAGDEDTRHLGLAPIKTA
jgi:hypothetical protein